jgi:putative ABC transport system permease protein
MFRELRHFSRVIRRSPASAAVAVVTLALTLGVGTALFALVDAIVLTPPPFVEPASVVLLGEVPAESMSASPRPVSWTTFEGWREYRQIVTQIEGFALARDLWRSAFGGPPDLARCAGTDG